MNAVDDLLCTLRSLGATLAVEGEELRCRGPREALTPSLLRNIQVHQTELIALLRAARRAAIEPPLLPARGREARPALSYAQERLWFLDRLGVSAPYNIRTSLRLSGELDTSVLERSFIELMIRHESLRTRFRDVDGEPFQVIDASVAFRLDVVDLSASGADERDCELRHLSREEGRRPFDLAADPLLRAKLLRFGPAEHVLLVTMHHIVSDGWSLGIAIREIGAFYAALLKGQEPLVGALPVQYSDYARWQREWLQGEVLQRQLAYWKEQLAGMPAALDLPTDRPRPALPSFAGDAVPVMLSKELCSALMALSRKEGATLYMVVLAAFQVLLGRYSGQTDVVVGSPIAGRRRSEIEGLIGFFVNMLVLRTNLSGAPSFREVLHRVKEITLDAYTHQDLPFDKLMMELRPARDLSRQSLFQVLFSLQNQSQQTPVLPGLTLDDVGGECVTTQFDLSLNLFQTPRGLQGSLEYATDLFERRTVECLVEHFKTLLAEIVADPDRRVGDLSLLAESERSQLVEEWNRTDAKYPAGRCLHESLSEQVARTPDAVALVWEGRRLSYMELECRSNQLANHLRDAGVGPEVVVGLFVERGFEMVIGLMAILKAGGVYLPLDLAHPHERLSDMLSDAHSPILITKAKLADRFRERAVHLVLLDVDWPQIAQRSTAVPLSDVRPDNLAYVLYTSGSTGQPKGVMVSHRSIVNYLCQAAGMYESASIRRSLVNTPLCFDATLTSLLVPLMIGKEVWLASEGAALEAFETILLGDRDPSLLKITPAHLEILGQAAAATEIAERVGVLVVGGEALPVEVARVWQHRAPRARIFNEYGPTEATVGCTVHAMNGETRYGKSVSIGRPIGNSRIYVLDTSLEPVAVRLAGSLYIGGTGLARGYLGRADLTAERFVPNPFGNGDRLYRTGDVARHSPDGNLEFLGRLDQQVKIRGCRVEPGEVEAALLSCEGVAQAVVVAREVTPGDSRLIGYVVGAGGVALEPGDLRNHLKRRLPEYMVPSAFVPLQSLPMTRNGKIDRSALLAPAGCSEVRPYQPPRTLTEQALASIWGEVLQLDKIGTDDNFFELGGHSLTAVRVVSRVRAALGIDLPLSALFLAPTIAELAALIPEREWEEMEIGPESEICEHAGCEPQI